jgi:hypothetical protein
VLETCATVKLHRKDREVEFAVVGAALGCIVG